MNWTTRASLPGGSVDVSDRFLYLFFLEKLIKTRPTTKTVRYNNLITTTTYGGVLYKQSRRMYAALVIRYYYNRVMGSLFLFVRLEIPTEQPTGWLS